MNQINEIGDTGDELITILSEWYSVVSEWNKKLSKIQAKYKLPESVELFKTNFSIQFSGFK